MEIPKESTKNERTEDATARCVVKQWQLWDRAQRPCLSYTAGALLYRCAVAICFNVLTVYFFARSFDELCRGALTSVNKLQ